MRIRLLSVGAVFSLFLIAAGCQDIPGPVSEPPPEAQPPATEEVAEAPPEEAPPPPPRTTEEIVLAFLRANVAGDSRFGGADSVSGIASCTPRDPGPKGEVFGCEWIVESDFLGTKTHQNDFSIRDGEVNEMYEWVSTRPTPLTGCGAYALGREPHLPTALNPGMEQRNREIEASWAECPNRPD